MPPFTHSIEDLDALLLTLQNTLGIVVTDEQRSDLFERVEILLVTHQLDSLASLASCLQENQAPAIRTEMLDALSQSQSSWDFSSVNIKLLCDYILLQLDDNARIWMAGCGQGQLAYLVAMEIAALERNNGTEKNFEIIATDAFHSNIDHARSAIYGEQQLKELREDYKKMFIVPDNKKGSGQVKEKIRQRLILRQCDLHDDVQSLKLCNSGSVDLIIAPESLAYYSSKIKADILQRMSAVLKPGGILLTGNNQPVMSAANVLERVERSGGVFYRKK
jgi:chemotaxis protein methyltransferase CheR